MNVTHGGLDPAGRGSTIPCPSRGHAAQNAFFSSVHASSAPEASDPFSASGSFLLPVDIVRLVVSAACDENTFLNASPRPGS